LRELRTLPPSIERRRRLDVFISHTSELAEFPTGVSFVEAVRQAVTRVGCHPVEMADFGARPESPLEYCRTTVMSCDIYIGVIGFRYGSTIDNDAHSRSYVEVELEVAKTASLPRLMFLLEDGDGWPSDLMDGDSRRIESFRTEVKRGGTLIATFRTADGLEASVSQALVHILTERRTAVDSRILPESPWMVPLNEGVVIDRPILSGKLIELLLRSSSGTVGITTALSGAGGFGKTTLAAIVTSQRTVRERFPGGVLWVTIGESVLGADLAAKINDLSERLGAKRPTLSDPEQAGLKLAELLAGRKDTLLVVDDVWQSSQLRPFLIGGSNCCRLVTTRIGNVLSAAAETLIVDQMERVEAQELISIGVRGMPINAQEELLSMMGGWPVLISLANASLRRLIARGTSPSTATRSLASMLKRAGPTAVDLRRPQDRSEAVKATVEASLSLLSEPDLDLFLNLAILPNGTQIPEATVAQWWSQTCDLSPDETSSLLDDFADLSLVGISPELGRGRLIRVHDVLRSYIRGRINRDSRRTRNAQFVNAMRGMLPDRTNDVMAASSWWLLPGSAEYIWRNLAYHMAQGDLLEELEGLLTDLRWSVAKIEVLGSADSVIGDLALIPGPISYSLREALSRAVHVLMPLRVPHALAMTLVSRLDDRSELAGIVSAYLGGMTGPRLKRVWVLPDQPSRGTTDVAAYRHTGWLRGCTADPAGAWIATFSNDQTIRVWRVSDGAQLLALAGHSAGVRGCAVSADGDRLVSVSNDRSVRVWDTSSGALLATLTGHMEPVCGCALADDDQWIISCSEDATVKVWDLNRQRVRETLKGHVDWVDGCATFPDGIHVATASADGTVRTWSIVDGRQTAVFSGHAGGVRTCAVSPDGRLIASGGSDNTVRLWDVRNSSFRKTLMGHTGPVNWCAFAPNGKWMLSASSDGTVRTWSISSASSISIFHSHAGAVRGAVIAHDGSWIASAGRDDGTLQISPVSPTGRTIGSDVRRLEVGVKMEREESEGHTDWVAHCAAAPNGRWIATSGADATIRLWDVGTRTVVNVLRGHSGGVRAAAISHDGTWLVSAGSDWSARLWDSETGETARVLSGHSGGVRGCAISPNDDWIATVSNDSTVRLWAAANGQLRATLEGHTGGVRACSIAPSGGWLASAGSDSRVFVWDPDRACSLAILEGHTSVVRDCAISPDERWLASAGADGVIKVWSVGGWEQHLSLEGHQGGVRGCAFDSTSRWLASVSVDQTIRVWNVENRECVTALRLAYSLSGCAWLPDDSRICVVGEGGVYLLSLGV